jgi:hypothetical protein
MRVHRNLHNARRGGPQWVHTHGGRVQAYLEAITLVNVSTRIQPAGQAKCQASGVRSVVAFFDGDEATTEFLSKPQRGSWQLVSYDPRRDSAFRVCAELPSHHNGDWNVADVAELRTDGSTWVLNARWEDKA